MKEDFPEPLGPNKITLHLLTFKDFEFDGMNIALSLRSLNDKMFFRISSMCFCFTIFKLLIFSKSDFSEERFIEFGT